jgi:hypothetical protein
MRPVARRCCEKHPGPSRQGAPQARPPSAPAEPSWCISQLGMPELFIRPIPSLLPTCSMHSAGTSGASPKFPATRDLRSMPRPKQRKLKSPFFSSKAPTCHGDDREAGEQAAFRTSAAEARVSSRATGLRLQRRRSCRFVRAMRSMAVRVHQGKESRTVGEGQSATARSCGLARARTVRILESPSDESGQAIGSGLLRGAGCTRLQRQRALGGSHGALLRHVVALTSA